MEQQGTITLYNHDLRKLETFNVHTGELVCREGEIPPSLGFTYTTDIAYAICSLMREGKTLKEISTLPKMPPEHLIYAWRKAHPDFKKALMEAKADRADYYHDRAVHILEEASDPQTGITNKDEVPAVKFKFDSYLRLAEVNNPDAFMAKANTRAAVGALQIIVNTGIVRDEPITVTATATTTTIEPTAQSTDTQTEEDGYGSEEEDTGEEAST